MFSQTVTSNVRHSQISALSPLGTETKLKVSSPNSCDTTMLCWVYYHHLIRLNLFPRGRRKERKRREEGGKRGEERGREEGAGKRGKAEEKEERYDGAMYTTPTLSPFDFLPLFLA